LRRTSTRPGLPPHTRTALVALLLAIPLLVSGRPAPAGSAGLRGIRPLNQAERSGPQRLTPVAFIDVEIVPADRAGTLPRRTVVVRGDRIVDVGPSDVVRIPEEALRIRAPGRYLAPGLADMHVHVYDENDLPLYVANGVTTIRVMGGNSRILDLRERLARRELLGPSIFTASPMVDGDPAVWPDADVLVHPERAEELVRGYAREGYDFVKVYVGLSRAVYDAVVRAARERGLRVVGHVPYDVPLEHVLRSGQASIEHLDGYIEAIQRDDSPYAGRSDLATRLYAVDWIDEEKITNVVRETVTAGVWTCPTFVVEQNWSTALEASPQFDRPELRYMRTPTVMWWRTHSGTNLSPAQRDYVRRLFEVRKKIVRALHRAGGKILAGSDSPNPLVIHGFSIHDELEYLRDAGLSNQEVLRAATANAAAFLGIASGRVIPGARADLLLLDHNPLEDLSHLRDPAGVLLRGAWYSRREMRAMLEGVREERDRRFERR